MCAWMSVHWGALFVCCWYGWWCSQSEQSNILGILLYHSIPSLSLELGRQPAEAFLYSC